MSSVAHQRRVPLDGASNFRDLGGYRTPDGTTCWGVVYRADGLQDLTQADLRTLDELGIRSVFDLRRDSERDARPTPLPNEQLCVLSRLDHGLRDAPDHTTIRDHLDGERLLRQMYSGMIDHAAPVFGQLLSRLADPDRLPAVFHCHGGKDRTGVAAALILELLGVDRATVLDDYELTVSYRTFEQQQDSYDDMLARGMGREGAAAVLGAPRWAMAEALDELDTRYGGIEAYLTGSAGMTAATVDGLRAVLID